MTKELLAETILAHLHMNRTVYVFGKYVRDKLAGQPFSEIKVWVNSGHDVDEIIRTINSIDNTGAIAKVGRKVPYGEGFEQIIEISRNGKKVFELGLVQSPKHTNPFVLKPDANVNSCFLDRNTMTFDCYGYNFETACENIENRTFTFDFTPSSEQVRELVNDGYNNASYHDITEAKKEEADMTTKTSILDTLKDRSIKGAYRAAGRNITRGTRNGIISMMKAKGADEGTLGLVTMFLETEFGEALISGAIGSALPNIPMLKDDARVQVLAEELQVEGTAVLMDAILKEVSAYLLPALVDALKTLPAVEEAERVRIEAAAEKEEEEKEDAEEVVKPRRARA